MSVLIRSNCFMARFDPKSRQSSIPSGMLSRADIRDDDSDDEWTDDESNSDSACSYSDSDSDDESDYGHKNARTAAHARPARQSASLPVTNSYLGQSFTCVVRFKVAHEDRRAEDSRGAPSSVKLPERVMVLGQDWFAKFAELFIVFGHPLPLPQPDCFVLETYTAYGVICVISMNHRLLPMPSDEDPDEEFAVDEEDDSWQWRVQIQSTTGHFIPVYQEQFT